jgi:F-type H+-transporting ATPase subunit b
MPTPAIILASAAAPVVDIDGTIFIQAGIFLLLMAVLHPLLFRPWLATRERREASITGTVQAAGELRAEAERVGADYDARLADVRGRAAAIRSEAVKAGEAERARRLGDSRTAANDDLVALRDRLTRQTEAARATLTARIDELATDIAAKILGRTP